MHNGISLREPLSMTGDDVERALFEQGLDEPAVARMFDRLSGVAAERAADELNRALEVDIFEVLAQGWAKVPAVHSAVQLSALTRGPPALINLDRHDIDSISHLMLESGVEQHPLPPLMLTLQLAAEIESATLAAREGRVELVALGNASIVAQLKYKSVLLKEHATGISGAPRDPFKRQSFTADRQASVDIPI